MDNRVKFKIKDRQFRRRCELLSRLDSPTQQQLEIGIVAGTLEFATNEKNWPLVEKLGALLIKYRESQQRARKEASQLVDVSTFKTYILGPVLQAIANRVRESCPDEWENIIDRISEDVRHVQLQPQNLLEDQRE